MTITNAAVTESSITIFQDLIASLPIDHLSRAQRDDLSAIAAESVEGLCHGLQYLSKSLVTETVTEHLQQISSYLNTCAHLIPVLVILSEHISSVHTANLA
ncbi:hypothetical protein WCU81_18820 [Pectobacterium atrosepticum]|uniref:hypothetical protein n=1 Tax=Pectobacterium atrosepticum TaxID=29471 RepID=UPI0004E836F1|nr:hypothetical protein [Pectobacterium atrosepticum]GKV87434.1 hypothetical protein PEC301296_37450 [Pectobacterium carotovorum subsp. carotovorum]AIK12052.1 hypothetical protein GZ59_01350 [Pectobacterium atrosepticum]KFX13597.1 hypothetical protein JV34_14765 [Pectobacterium atrosepticum]KMK83483.1 hypothetical protein KCQ_06862 [Pectobacterium atrosepticum ICMP 1526]MCL6392315.1 hypothetical protein [Pectobacterium atrosepticum]